MSASTRLLARLLPLALPLTVACGAKSELLSEDPDDNTAGRAGTGGSAGRAGTGGTVSSGGSTSSAGTGGTVSATGGGAGNGGSGTLSVGGSGGAATTRDLPPCALASENCPTFCYVGAADEACLPSFPEQPVHERLGCEVQIAGSTSAPGQKPGECCYIVGFCGGGRPLVAAGRALVAPLCLGGSWR